MQLQLGDAGIEAHDLVENRLRFQGDVHRLAAGLVFIQGLPGFFQVLLDLRQLLLEKRQALRRLSRGALHVLPHVDRRDLIEDFDRLVRLGAFQRQADHARLLPSLDHIQVLLIVEDAGQSRIADHPETRAGLGAQFFNLECHAILLERLPGLAGRQHLVIFIHQGVVCVFTHGQGQLLAQLPVGQVQLEDLQRLAAPGEAVQAQQRLGDCTGVGLLEAARQELTHYREVHRLYDDIEFQVVDGFANHVAGLDQLDLGGRRRLLAQHPADVREAQQVVLFRFDLQQGIRLVDRGCQHRIGGASDHKGTGHRSDQPFMVDQCSKQTEEINLPVIVFLYGDCWRLLHKSDS